MTLNIYRYVVAHLFAARNRAFPFSNRCDYLDEKHIFFLEIRRVTETCSEYSENALIGRDIDSLLSH